MLSRTKFWNEAWTCISCKSLAPFLNGAFYKGFQLSETSFSNIQRQVFKILYKSLNKEEAADVGCEDNQDRIIQKLNSTQSFSVSVVPNLDLFVELERLEKSFRV